MNLVSRRHRVLAVLVGIALLVVVVMQILHDGPHVQIKKAKSKIQSITK
ncbi:MAG: hypothetical protein WDO14_01665 [Bacteroidota bacterium]